MEKKWCNGHNKILYMYEIGCTITLRGLKSIIVSMFYTSFYIALFNYVYTNLQNSPPITISESFLNQNFSLNL